jgi:hypothetical protein
MSTGGLASLLHQEFGLVVGEVGSLGGLFHKIKRTIPALAPLAKLLDGHINAVTPFSAHAASFYRIGRHSGSTMKLRGCLLRSVDVWRARRRGG